MQRLGQHIHGARAQGGKFGRIAGVRCHHHHRAVAREQLTFELLADLQPAHARCLGRTRHVQVQQHHIGSQGFGHVEPFRGAVGRVHRRMPLHQRSEQVNGLRVVINDEQGLARVHSMHV